MIIINWLDRQKIRYFKLDLAVSLQISPHSMKSLWIWNIFFSLQLAILEPSHLVWEVHLCVAWMHLSSLTQVRSLISFHEIRYWLKCLPIVGLPNWGDLAFLAWPCFDLVLSWLSFGHGSSVGGRKARRPQIDGAAFLQHLGRSKDSSNIQSCDNFGSCSVKPIVK